MCIRDSLFSNYIKFPTEILDRVLHNAYRLELSGESLRKKRAPALDA